MMEFPENLRSKLDKRSATNTLRNLTRHDNLIDFTSNDYLGLAHNKSLLNAIKDNGLIQKIAMNGATGSRLLTGQNLLVEKLEEYLTDFYSAKAALLFNSGYDANIGLLSAIAQRRDIVLYDEFIHASIRDGINLGKAKSYKFRHNDFEDLSQKLIRLKKQFGSHGIDEIYVVTESVFSMDGDTPDLVALMELSQKHQCRLIIDEAHAVGVFGEFGAGKLAELNLEAKVFARIVTFGKGLGCHGAAILGSEELKEYLVNYARSFMYTTALPPHSLISILEAHRILKTPNGVDLCAKLGDRINFFNQELIRLELKKHFLPSTSAIQICIIKGNDNVKLVAQYMVENGFDIRAIVTPSIKEGMERLRICIHSYNDQNQISAMLGLLKNQLQ